MYVSIKKHMKQNILAEYKLRNNMGKMAGNGLRILALLTTPPSSYFYKGRQPLDKGL